MNIEEIATRIVDAAIKVHTVLGPGLMESAYPKCIEYELRKDGLTVECEVVLPIIYESLMDSVKGVEEEIARQRYTYNNISQEFNTLMDTIPSNIIGRLIGLIKLEYLQFEEAIKTPPKIEF